MHVFMRIDRSLRWRASCYGVYSLQAGGNGSIKIACSHEKNIKGHLIFELHC
jgi:hypothetical protein